MPYLDILVSPGALAEAAQARLAAGATRLFAEVLGKRADLTVVRIAADPAARWHVAGASLPGTGRAVFAEARITRGTNSAAEKARFLDGLHGLLAEAAGPLAAPAYIVIHELPAADWGYDGLSQAARGARP